MKNVKKLFIMFLPIILLTVFLFVVLSPNRVDATINVRVKDQLAEDIAKNGEKLASLLKLNEGEYINKDQPSFASFSPLFSIPLDTVDTRKPDYAIFSFTNIDFHPEKSTYLFYIESDVYSLNTNHTVSVSNPEVNLENQGVNGKGYIHCTRLHEGWFLFEAYLPT